jgi:hypothetical protein
MTIIDDKITVILLANMFVLKGKWSAMVSVSEVKAQMSLDLLFMV